MNKTVMINPAAFLSHFPGFFFFFRIFEIVDKKVTVYYVDTLYSLIEGFFFVLLSYKLLLRNC